MLFLKLLTVFRYISIILIVKKLYKNYINLILIKI